MEPLARALHAVVPVLWTAAACTYFTVFLRDDEGASRWAVRLAVLAALAHVAELAASWGAGVPPLVVPGALIGGMGLAAAVVYLVVERRVHRRTIGIFAVGPAAVLATAGAAVGTPLQPPPQGFPPAQVSLHVAGAILGYGGLLLAAIFGALLLAQRRALRARRFGLFWERLPSVELLDAFTANSLGTGTLFLTATIGLGHATRHAAERTGTYWDAKVIATNALWALCLGVFAARKLRGLRPPATAAAALVLFGLALFNMFAVDRWSKVHEGL